MADLNEVEVTYSKGGELVSERMPVEQVYTPPSADPTPTEPSATPEEPSATPPEPSPTPEAEPEPPAPEDDDDDESDEPIVEGKETRSQRYRRRRQEELEQVRQEAQRERQRADEYWNALRELQQGRSTGERLSVQPVVPPEMDAFLRGDDPRDPEPVAVEWDGETDYGQFVQEQARVQARWEARREFRAQQRIAQMQAQQQRQQQQVQTWAQKHQEIAAQRGVSLVPAEQVPVTPTMQDFFVNEADGVEVSVYLREPEHVAEAHRISMLPPHAQDRALSRLAATLAQRTEPAVAPATRTHTSASPVVPPVQPSATNGDLFDPMDPSSVTDPDYFTKFQQWSQRRSAAR